MEKQIKMEDMVNYCKNYGFIFQGSEIYGGLANTWDYGPLGARLKNNLKDAWRYYFIQLNDKAYEVDADILMHPTVWKASGHLASFSDPLLDCKECKRRVRADNLIEDFDENAKPDLMTYKEMSELIKEHQIPCPSCGKCNFTEIRDFNLMFQTKRGVTEGSENTIYLRPENAQGEYVNYLNVLRSMRTSIPFAIGQVGKAFRNEITPGNFTFRTIEFEQMEFQNFVKPGTDMKFYEEYKKIAKDFFLSVGLDEDKMRYKDHDKLAHYAKAACDIEYKFPFGWGEINGTHNRTDFDLKNHQEYSKISHEYLEVDTKERYIPYIVESTIGVDRFFLAVLFNSLKIEDLDGEERLILKIKPSLAPITVNVFPLVKKYHSEKASEIYNDLKKHFMASYDEAGNIGKRYRRSDAIGVPFVVTIDDETLNNDEVTVRFRDTMEQEKVKVSDLEAFIKKHLEG